MPPLADNHRFAERPLQWVATTHLSEFVVQDRPSDMSVQEIIVVAVAVAVAVALTVGAQPEADPEPVQVLIVRPTPTVISVMLMLGPRQLKKRRQQLHQSAECNRSQTRSNSICSPRILHLPLSFVTCPLSLGL